MSDSLDIVVNYNPIKDRILELLRAGVCEVTFLKKDGTRRVMIGTLLPELIAASFPTKLPVNPPEAPVVEEVQPARETDQIRLFDIEANAWRSFKLGNFITIDPRYTGVAIEE